MLNLAIGLSGNGSTFQAIYEACLSKKINAQIQLVFTDNIDSFGIQRAKKYRIPTILHIDKKIWKQKEQTISFVPLLNSLKIDFICLAGFLKKIPSDWITSYPNCILNSHPSLLPKYGGKGMYGMNVHKAVIDNKDTETGCTIHLVNEEYDEGNILAQKKLKVLESDNAESLQKRLILLEHETYIQTIKKFENDLKNENNVTNILNDKLFVDFF